VHSKYHYFWQRPFKFDKIGINSLIRTATAYIAILALPDTAKISVNKTSLRSYSSSLRLILIIQGASLVQEKITVVVDYLNEVKTRCTFNAAAEALGITPQALKKLLGDARPEVSWFVSPTSGEPMRYADSEKHPELYRTSRIITSSKVLKRNLDL
jgi:hypothetical protein